MDQQMKRGFTEASVLAALATDESYGYQIIRDMPPALDLTESTLYPVLKRLEAAGSVTTRSAAHNGRLRKYYRITDMGRERLQLFTRERAEVASVYDFIERKVGAAGTTMNAVGVATGCDNGHGNGELHGDATGSGTHLAAGRTAETATGAHLGSDNDGLGTDGARDAARMPDTTTGMHVSTGNLEAGTTEGAAHTARLAMS